MKRCLLLVFSLLISSALSKSGDVVVYRDSFSSDWADNSYAEDNGTVDVSSTDAHFGAAALKVSSCGAWSAVVMSPTTPIASKEFVALAFWWKGEKVSDASFMIGVMADSTTAIVSDESQKPSEKWSRVVVQIPSSTYSINSIAITVEDSAIDSLCIDDVVLVAKQGNLACGDGVLSTGEQCDFDVTTCNPDTCCFSGVSLDSEGACSGGIPKESSSVHASSSKADASETHQASSSHHETQECGDGIVEGSEQCDGGVDCLPNCTCLCGMVRNGSGCIDPLFLYCSSPSNLSSSCEITHHSSSSEIVPELCGNKKLDPGESCDGGAHCVSCLCPVTMVPDGLTPPGCKLCIDPALSSSSMHNNTNAAPVAFASTLLAGVIVLAHVL